MDFQNHSSAWSGVNLGPPTSFDEDFLALLQRQIAANPQQLLIDPTRFPAPPIEQPTPPLSEQSSPGPSEDASTPANVAASPSKSRQNRVSLPNMNLLAHRDAENDPHKRKATEESDDEDEGQPTHKSQHMSNESTASASKKAGAGRRKSTNNGDDTRLLKRKEQNRAAQRAFRERKEKHVKDLEDKVADLEAKNDSQAVENENLRELLTRLQNENLLLKQAAFTFSVPRNGNTNSGGNNFNPMFNGGANNTSSISPNSSSQFSSLFGNSPPAQAHSPQSTFSGGFNYVGSPTLSLDDIPGLQQMNSSGTPWTTISANPLFTSFSDPSMNSWASFGPPAPAMQSMSTPVQSMSDGMANLRTSSSSGGLSPFGLEGPLSPGSTLDAILGTSMDTSYTGFFSSPTGPAPVSPQPASGSSNTPENNSAHSSETCPRSKEDVARMISSTPQSTFGPPVVDSSYNSPPSSSSPPSSGVIGPHISVPGNATAEDPLSALCASLPQTAKSPSQIEIGKAWDHVRQHPQFEECDIDALCHELSAKARCDGEKPVLEKDAVESLVSNVLRKTRQSSGGQMQM